MRTIKYYNIIKWWLIGILLFFPFLTPITHKMNEYGYNLFYVRLVDEITIIIFIFVAVWKLYKRKELLNPYFIVITIAIVVFSIVGIISGVINGNSMKITILGMGDYIKYFLVIFIYAVYFRDIREFDKVYRLLLMIAVFLSVGSIIQELWALTSRYLLNKDVHDPIMYILGYASPAQGQINNRWRFGLLRTGFIIKNANMLGFYLLLIVTLGVNINKKISPFICVILLGGILFSLSRMVYSGLFLVSVATYLVHRRINRKWIIGFVLIALLIIPLASVIVPEIDSGVNQGQKVLTYRDYAREKGLLIWKDNPIVGVGPGMFGGVISKKYLSPLYEEYNFGWNLLDRIGSIDQFWPQVIAEMGIAGLILFASIIIVIIKVLFIILKEGLSDQFDGLIRGLLIFWLAIYTYTFGSGFNTTEIIFPYFAMIGIVLGSVNGIISQQKILSPSMNCN